MTKRFEQRHRSTTASLRTQTTSRRLSVPTAGSSAVPNSMRTARPTLAISNRCRSRLSRAKWSNSWGSSPTSWSSRDVTCGGRCRRAVGTRIPTVSTHEPSVSRTAHLSSARHCANSSIKRRCHVSYRSGMGSTMHAMPPRRQVRAHRRWGALPHHSSITPMTYIGTPAAPR